MRAILVAALAMTLGVGSAAHAQEPLGPSRFDLGVYGGGSWTTDWLDIHGAGFGFGVETVFGGFATYWTQPRFGLRLHGAYIPAELPRSETAQSLEVLIADGRPLNAWLYDLDLMLRPLAESENTDEWLRSAYLFVGGGGLTTNPAGEGDEISECVFPYYTADACLPHDASTVAQGTLGAGVGFIPLTDRVGAFGELGLHVYDSPFRVGGAQGFVPNPDCPDECVGDDGPVLTTRLVGGLALGRGRPVPEAFLLPLPPPPAVSLPVARAERPLRLCVLVDGFPHYVDAFYLPESGDTVVVDAGSRRPFSAVYPVAAEGASEREWFVNDEPIYLMGRPYRKVGLPLVASTADFAPAGEYEGVPVFASADGGESPPARVYVPAGDGCQLQPYQLEEELRRVRG